MPSPKGVAGSEWWCSHFENMEELLAYKTEMSGKLVVLQKILKECESIGDKVLVFSQYLTTLNIIERFLEGWDKEGREVSPYSFIKFNVSLSINF